jgi:choline-sulfatase
VTAAATLCGACGAAPAGRPAAPAAAHNVLVITVDTLRADHLPAYGYKKLTTPAISRLADEGVRFESAFTPAPLTLPAHSSAFTGMQPFRHGVRDNGGFYLDPQRPTLASTLKAHGFQTAAFVSAFVLDSQWGLSTGFDRYYDDFSVKPGDLAAMARVQRTGDVTWTEARGWLDAHAGGKFFVWLHLFDPHTPYEPPEPYRSQHAGHPYDGEIAYSDAIVGQMIAFLEARRLLDNTLIVLLSDHGEGLGDHGEQEHGLLAYDSTLRVPWIVRLPDRARRGIVVERPVSLVDVFPTILGLLGLTPPAGLDGVDLTPLVTGTGAVPADALYAETYYPRLRFNWSELVSVRNRQYKFIRAPRRELYDFRADPTESHNLAEAQPSVVAGLEQILDRMAGDATAAASARGMDPDAARRLESLGYVAGGGAAMRAGGTRADPKDKVEVYRALARARELLERGSDREAVNVLQTIVQQDPELEAARRLLRDYWLQRRQLQRGADWFRAAAARHRTPAALLNELGTFELAAGRPGRAAAAFQQALAQNAGSVDALTGAADAARAAGDLPRALDFLRKAAAQSSDAPPRMRLADMLIRVGQLAEAETLLAAVLAADSHVAGAHYLLAQIAEQQRDMARAEREYRLELAVAPWEYRAAFNLATLAGIRKDHREQVVLLESVTKTAPEFGDGYFYLAKALLDLGDRSRFQEAIAAATRGLQLAPSSPRAPLGHYVLADVYGVQGRTAEAQRHLRLGRELENAR